MQQGQLSFYKIPFQTSTKLQSNSSNNNLTIIGVIDASGSMSSCWKWLADFWNQSIPKDNLITITFSSSNNVVEDNILSSNIGVHGGQTTAIVPAFERLEKELKKVPIENNVTIIFISDGQDDRVSTLDSRMKTFLRGNQDNRIINFICLGVQKSFPTNLSMNLRQLYHNGDPQVPAIYLIEYASAQAFFNKFETMKPYFQAKSIVKLNQYVNLYPYDETITSETFEGQWVIFNGEKLAVLPQDQKQIPLDGIAEKDLEILDAIDIFRAWIQNLQIKILQQKLDYKIEAEVCAEVMIRITNQLSNRIGVDILSVKGEDLLDPNKNFHQRAKEAFIYKHCSKLVYFIQEAQSLAKGVNPGQLSEFDQAKRMMIGTITGKHHQKALALKGITIQEFQLIKKEFEHIILNCNFKKENQQGQERSVITLENQRDILIDKAELIKSLNYINSQYDFAETFPLIGHGLKVRRKEGSQINPWLVEVENFAQQNKVIDSGYLIKNNFLVKMNIGGQDQEEINCILPLYDETDNDLQPFLRSRIIKLLMTFMVQQNVDTLFEETYLALLANALMFIIQEKPSQWREEIIQLIYSTVKIVYSGTEQFETYLQKLVKDPAKAYFEIEQAYENHVALAKPFLYLFYALEQNLIEDLEVQFERLFCHHFYRAMMKLQKKNNNCFFYFDVGKENDQQIISELKTIFPKFLYLAQLEKALPNQLLKIIQGKASQIDKQVKINVSKNLFDQNLTSFSRTAAELLYERYAKKKFDHSRYMYIIFHAMKYKDQQMVLQKVQYDCDNEIAEIIKTSKGDLSYYEDLIRNEYKTEFIKQHQIVKPLTKAEIMEEQKRLGLNGDIVYNNHNGLAKNCCLAKDCPFYLIPKHPLEIRKHLQNWSHIPIGFHEFVIQCLKQNLQEQDIIQNAIKKWAEFPKLYEGSIATVKNYIKIISESQIVKV